MIYKITSGLVIKITGRKTITVLVEFTKKIKKYNKMIHCFKKYLVHDEHNISKVGDLVHFSLTNPISKKKKFILISKKTKYDSK